ncbi:DUF2845 domain-containing protein [Facilibium subflavum]|uniref:DUF2845 domain-containing protein n=1 Tax=Facilibium subflavum TaxID=2219058 RepID=UPI000E653FB2|nr:DUF2845 domain-containing protein [Facilibium subflavum]
MVKRLLITGALSTTLLISSTGFTATNSVISCDGKNVTLGMSVKSLMDICGKPFSEYNRTNKSYVKYKTLAGTVETETKFKFVDDKLVSISYEQEDEAKES